MVILGQFSRGTCAERLFDGTELSAATSSPAGYLHQSYVSSPTDLTCAFLRVEVDENFRNLLTYNTYRGLNGYNRLPPRVKATPGAFQQLIDTMLLGLKGVSGYLDDFVVGGVNEEDHNRNLHEVLQRIDEFKFIIRTKRCSFGMSQIQSDPEASRCDYKS